ncbi:6-bladed beta-propeller [Algibacter pacificus]|uniref:6-bladed beta-propeller n=1 Tax=Algibacter pacificus TaxID=2599389 RepID=UPI0011CB7FC2|nr:6-bladed beta-propeller [Algibacter pacificus]
MKNFLILFLFILGCKESNEANFPQKIASIDAVNIITKTKNIPIQIKIDLSKKINGDFDDYFKLKKIIYLDDKNPVGSIATIRQHKDKIFVLDRENAQQLFCFDINGNFVWEFKGKGGGPLEYNRISDFIINDKKGTVDVLDKNRFKIINLDINTGIAKKEFKLGFYGREMVLYKNGMYLVHTENLAVNRELSYKLLLVNENQEVKSRNLSIGEFEKNKQLTGFRSIEKSNGLIYFTETLNDTIYTIKNDTLRNSYYVDFMDKKYPDELKFDFKLGKALKLKKDKPYISPIDQVREKNGFISFTFSYKGSLYSVFFNKKDKRTYIFDKLKYDKSLGEDEQIFYRGFIDDGLVKIVNPYMFDQVRDLIKSNQKFRNNLIVNKKQIYDVITRTNSSSNPILFIYEFKKID